MDSEVIKKYLMSNNINEIEKAIDKIYNSKNSPSDDLIPIAINLTNHSDYEIRRRIINTFALHFVIVDFVPALLEMLKGKENDDIVLGTIISALSRIADVNDKYKNEIIRVLANVVLDEKQEDDIRGDAYNNILQLTGSITNVEFARRTENDIEKLDVDWDWINSIK